MTSDVFGSAGPRLVGFLLLLVTCWGCSSGPRYPYPQEALDFMDENCSFDESEFCKCVAESLQERVPYRLWEGVYLTEEVVRGTPEWHRFKRLHNDVVNSCQ